MKKFLVDAQLPKRLTLWLKEAGHDAIHTLDLPRGNRTTDTELNEVALREGGMVLSKDGDFVESLLVTGRPSRLLLVSTGNISNAELEALSTPTFPLLPRRLKNADFWSSAASH